MKGTLILFGLLLSAFAGTQVVVTSKTNATTPPANSANELSANTATKLTRPDLNDNAVWGADSYLSSLQTDSRLDSFLSPSNTLANEYIYTTNNDDEGFITKYRASNGSQVWQLQSTYQIGNTTYFPRSISAYGGFIYVAYGDRYLAQLNASDAQRNWLIDTGGVESVSASGGSVFTTSTGLNGVISKYNASNGSLVWSIVTTYVVGTTTYFPRYLRAWGDSLYLTYGFVYVAQLRASDGQRNWVIDGRVTEFPTTYNVSSLGVSGTHVYVTNSTPSEHITKYKACDGDQVWRVTSAYQVNNTNYLPRFPVSSGDNYFYVGYGNRYLSKLRVSNAEREWLFDAGVTIGATTYFLTSVAIDITQEPQTYTVTSTNDNGCGSLRQAISDANATLGTDTIEFSIGTGTRTIAPTSPLPAITNPVIIDGTTQPGYAGSPIIELNGANTSGNGLSITAGASTVKGLVINRFSGSGMVLQSNGGNTILGNYIGSDVTGTVDLGNSGMGVVVSNAPNNTIGGVGSSARNIISGNNGSGISISGSAATGNAVQGNLIGTDVHGTADLGNSLVGVLLTNGAANNTIGQSNVISGNNASGIEINTNATSNIILGNYIGTSVNGSSALGNGLNGVLIIGAPNNTVGGTTSGARNIISGNAGGVGIVASTSTGNLVQGNFIGTDVNGIADIGNSGDGVIIAAASSNNTIGGTTAGARNIISGNNSDGIEINNNTGVPATGNTVQGNYIGTDVNGSSDLGNSFQGVNITNTTNNTIGGTGAGAGNFIAFNDSIGVRVSGATATGNSISGNSIFSNTGLGIDLAANGVSRNDLEDSDTGANNLQNFPVVTSASGVGSTNILGTLNSTSNTSFTIELFSNTSFDPSLHGEGQTFLGSTSATTNAGGNASFSFTATPELPAGTYISATATRNTAPLDTSEFSRCFLLGAGGLACVTNTNDSGIGSLRQTIFDAAFHPGTDTICFNIAGAGPHTIALLSALPIIDDPVIIDGTTQPGFSGAPIIELNGTSAGAGANGLNVVAGESTIKGIVINLFSGNGIVLQFNGGNTIQGNYIGTNSAGTADFGNSLDGVRIDSSPNNLIGGTTAADRNIISGNNINGVSVSGSTATGNQVQGNYIGTDVNGAADLGNSGNGIFISSATNIIGGTTAAARNVISGNNNYGALISGGGATENIVQGNYLGTTASGTAALGNSIHGVNIDTASNNTIGGAIAAARNLISGNSGKGVGIFNGSNNTVSGNYIGTDLTGTVDLGNGTEGVGITSASNNTVGGTAAGAGNLISGNNSYGVFISGSTATGNQLQGNYIGTDVTGTLDLGNSFDGVFITSGANNTIGGTSAGARNIISGNGNNGVDISGSTATGNLLQGNFIGTTVNGTAMLGNSGVGVAIGSATNMVGGTAAGAGNVISGNDTGVVINGTGATGNQVQGNLIGTDVTGSLALANSFGGVSVGNASNNVIGGTSAGARNIISGNTASGVVIFGSGGIASGNTVQGNYIGTDVSGASPLGNSDDGVAIFLSAVNNTIGGMVSGAGNVIAFNGLIGVRVSGSTATANAIRGNFIFSNSGLGIDLNGNSTVDPNDAGDADAGANNRQNYPVITSADSSSGSTMISGTLNSTASTSFAIELFSNTAFDPSFYGEGQTFLGSTTVTTDGNGNTSFSFTASPELPAGVYISATATRNAAPLDTSEFSRCFLVGSTPPGPVTNTNDSGAGSLRQAIIDANFNPGTNTISFNFSDNAPLTTTVNLLSPLPTIDDPIIIDGTTAPGYSGSPIIELNGSGAGANANGLTISGGNSTVKALVINRFSGSGIVLQTNGGNTIQGCYIGTDVGGSVDMGNLMDGVVINLAPNNTIGGTAIGAGNVIAFNDTRGVRVSGVSATRNSIRGNSIFSNAGLGIDFNGDGVTANDAGDSDTGPNNLQNFPLLTSVATNGTSTTIQGTLNSTSGDAFAIDFYHSLAGDGGGAGRTYIGSTTVMTATSAPSGPGDVAFNVTFPVAVPLANVVTATANRDATGDTSEFSQTSVPTAIELIEFAAKSFQRTHGKDGGTRLEWRTGFEVANLGFNVYRDENGKRTRINTELIAGSALFAGVATPITAGRSYVWRDASAAASTGYWLEAIDLSGQSAWHGPIRSQAVQSSGGEYAEESSTLSGIGNSEPRDTSSQVESKAGMTKASAVHFKAQGGIATQTSAKIYVRREGWYRITEADLRAVGFDEKGDSRFLQLFVDGREMPMLIQGESDVRFDSLDSVEFYGVGLDSASSDERVYWLVSGNQPGLRIKQSKSEGTPSHSTSFTSTVERRDRTIYFAALRNGERENFFGSVVHTQPVDQSVTLPNISQAPMADAVLYVTMQGVTLASHRVRVEINGYQMGELRFEGQAQGSAKFNVPHSLLAEGQNVVRLVAFGGQSDVSLVDTIRVSYEHSYTADSNSLRLSAPGNQQISIAGFTAKTIRVFDVTNPNAPQELLGDVREQQVGKGEPTAYSISFAATESGERKLLATTSEQQPARLSLNQPSNLRQAAGDSVIITQREFMAAVEPLVALRQDQGLSVAVIDIEDIYDEFSYGQKTPQAIKDFLSTATRSWKIPARYSLLFGDASLDPKNYLGYGYLDLVPTKLIDTSFLETASDDWLADFDQDGIADIAIGRMPVRTRAEADVVVAKLIAYESSKRSNEVLLVSDKNDVFDFENASAQIVPLLPPNLRINEIKRGELGDAAAKAALIAAINRGQRIVNYTGHGSVDSWRGGLLTSVDASELKNGSLLATFVMMNCLNGYFQDPVERSLAEALLNAPEGGAVAVWASSGLTFAGVQTQIDQEFFRQVFNNRERGMRIGDAVMRAKGVAADSDARRTWILFGDPTMILR